MPKFWVIFDYAAADGRRRESMAMVGATGRHVAAEVRTKYRDVRFESISAIGVGKSARSPGYDWG